MQIRTVKKEKQYNISERLLRQFVPRTGNYWEDYLRELLVKVALYQFGLYPSDKLENELDVFFSRASEMVCGAVRRNGGICFQELVDEYNDTWEATKELLSEMRNFRSIGSTGKYISSLLSLSHELYYARSLPLKKKILLFDKVVHAVHGAGAFIGEGFTFDEASIFGVDIPRIKREADAVIQKILVLKK